MLPQTEPGQRPATPIPRMHAVTLCCAESVATVVSEVAHSLEGLGFRTGIVTGSDARAALMERERSHDGPMIYVVCVQGTLKDTVLGPLRQALATHGGPNEHLFVAVLDLSLPLSMVGQVRRFAEALERMPGDDRRDPLHERRQWREHSGNHLLDESDTRAYRAVARAESAPRTASSTGARPIVTSRKPARIEPTRKYRAVTGPVPTVRDESGPRGGANRVQTVPPRTMRRRIHVPGLETRTVIEDGDVQPVARFGANIADAPERSGLWVFGLVVLVVAAAGVASYALGVLDGVLPDGYRAGPTAASGAEVASASSAKAQANEQPVLARGHEAKPALDPPAEPASEAETQPDSAPEPKPEPEPAEERGTEPEPEPAPEPDAPAEPEPAAQAEPEAPTKPEPEPKPAPPPEPEPAPPVPTATALEEPAAPAVEAALADAIERRVVKVSNTYYVARPKPSRARWDGARKLCRDLAVDSVDDWRLPFRRELQLLGAIGMLTKDSYWSRTVDTDDSDYAVVYERGARRLTSWEKTETAEVVCVRKRN